MQLLRSIWAAGGLIIFLGCNASPFEFDQITSPANSALDTFSASSHTLTTLRQNLFAFDDVLNEPIVYRLGNLQTGSIVNISVQSGDTAEGGPLVGVFNSAEEATMLNRELADRRGPARGNATFEVLYPDDYFVVLARPVHLRMAYTVAGTVIIQNGGLHEPKPIQTIVLDFDGGTAQMGAVRYVIEPFDAGKMDGAFAGLTTEIKGEVLSRARSTLADYSVNLISTDETSIATSYSAILFGGRNIDNMGMSQAVDSMNDDCCDESIVFTDQICDFFDPRPDFDQICTLLANVAGHEAGHLMGLNHTNNPSDVMDVSASRTELLEPRRYAMSVLDPSTFPLGVQNGPALLRINLGER